MTDIFIMSVRFVLFADLMLMMGLAAFPLYALRRTDPGEARIASELAAVQPWLCGAGLLISLAGMLVLTASMQGIAIGDLDTNMLLSMAIETDAGKAWIVRMLVLALATVAAIQRDRYPFLAATGLSVASAIALASLVWSGHAAASEGLAGTGHRLSDALHLIAGGIWFGAIAAFLILLRPTAEDVGQAKVVLAARSLDQFARIGTICVLIIAATGLINLEMIVGIAQAGRMVGTTYGDLLIAKLLLFGLMLGLAALNRWRLTPAFAATASDASARAMRRSLMFEGLAAAAILALVAILGVLEP
jgi:copper resistance protein D